MIPLGMAGILRAMADRDSIALSLFLISFVYGATLVVFFTNIRIRLPLLVVWIPYSVSGIVAFIDGFFLRRIRPMVLLLGTAILFSIITYAPLPCAYDMSGHYNTHAINLMGKDREKEAIAYWKASADMKKPYSAYANLALAGYYRKRGFQEKALEFLGKIPENSFAASQKYERLADLLRPFDINGSIKIRP